MEEQEQICKLEPLLALQEMSMPPLVPVVAAAVSNLRALSKVITALQGRAKQPISDASRQVGDEGFEDNDIVSILLYWGFTVAPAKERGSFDMQQTAEEERQQVLVRQPPLVHLKMIRKRGGVTEVLIGPAPKGAHTPALIAAGNVVCRHVQRTITQGDGPLSAAAAGSSPDSFIAPPPLGKKTPRAAVDGVELQDVFAGASIQAVPAHSPLQRNFWEAANGQWPMTTPTPKPHHFVASKSAYKALQEGEGKVPPVITSEELLTLNALSIVARYKSAFFGCPVEVGVAIVCRIETREVIAAVQASLSARKCSHSCVVPYAVDEPLACELSSAAVQLLNSSEVPEQSATVATDDAFFAHATFEALRVASKEMFERHSNTKNRTDEPRDSRPSVLGVEYLCNGLDLITNVEPCTMCAMACVHSRLNRLIFLHPNIGGHGGVSGNVTGPLLEGPSPTTAAEDNEPDENGATSHHAAFRIHCCPTLNHHFSTFKMTFPTPPQPEAAVML